MIRNDSYFRVLAQQLLGQIPQLSGERVWDGKVLAAHHLEHLMDKDVTEV